MKDKIHPIERAKPGPLQQHADLLEQMGRMKRSKAKRHAKQDEQAPRQGSQRAHNQHNWNLCPGLSHGQAKSRLPSAAQPWR
jgi:hypothetical protein